MAQNFVNVGHGPKDYPGYPAENRDANGKWAITERYWVRKTAINNTLPAHNATVNQNGATVTDRDGNTLKCRSVTIEHSGGPGVVTVELQYAQSETSISLKGPADNPRSVRLTREDIPIDDERLLVANGGVFSAAQIATAKQTGYASLPLYGIEYTYTELDASFAWTEAAIIASLQSTGGPTGIGSATAAKWELTGKEIDETDEETIIREHYRFAAAGVLPIKA